MSSYATPSTQTSTPGTIARPNESITSGRFFNSNNSHSHSPHSHSHSLPPSSIPQHSANRMVFLEELSNQERAQKEQRERELHQQMAEASGSGSASDHNRRAGGGGATFLSDEETNASDAGSAFDRPPPTHLESSIPPLSTAGNKGKGKAEEYDPTPLPTTTTTTTGSATKKKPVKGKKAVGADGKPVATREKKKKAGRACAACQKAHLTCDDGRPCARCIKKGCPEDCVDGARKKAKYLQEVPDELLDRNRHPHAEGTPTFGNGVQLLDSPSAAVAQPSQSPNPPHTTLPSSSRAPQPTPSTSQPIFDFSTTSASTSLAPQNPSYYDPTSFLNFATTPSASLDHTHFGSEAANLEYAILSSMLNGNGFALDAHTPNLSGGIGGGGGGFDPRYGGANGRAPIGEETLLGGGQGMKEESGATNEGFRGTFGQDGTREQQDTEMFSTNEGGEERSVNRGQAGGIAGGSGVPGLMTAEESLRSVTKPYPYAQSYHFLVKHLKTRFEKNDILRIVRALATFRPSLIALQMPLTEEDETFVERTFQRTLVELNKLISFSGTPTVVWRRTGEICLVGTEFCLLTGWKREELVGTGNVNGVTTSGGGRAGGGKYIFELFDTASVVEYYESFAKHAFESTSTSVTLQCVVLGPDGRPVPCAFCFSVRRDLFSCPFLIIGSFLPILI